MQKNIWKSVMGKLVKNFKSDDKMANDLNNIYV